MPEQQLQPLTIHVSKAFRNGAFPLRHMTHSAALYTDYAGLLVHLERLLGCSPYSTNTEYLRVELYRQSLNQWLEKHPDVFYAKSYHVDRFATATVCLSHRDNLMAAGFDFNIAGYSNAPRLHAFCGVEEIFRKKINQKDQHVLAFGEADRFRQVIALVAGANLKTSVHAVLIHDVQSFVPIHIRHLAEGLATAGVVVEWVDQNQAVVQTGTDLAHFVAKLSDPNLPKLPAPQRDGSLVILNTHHDLSGARWLAAWLKQSDHTNKPILLAPTGQSVLAQSLHAEGLPSTGIVSASIARPALQMIKLAPCFLWQPFDVYKVMEFVNLPISPLSDALARIISQTLAQKPGFDSELWYARVQDFLDQAPAEVVSTYRFFFKRKRYDSDSSVPRREVLDLYTWIADWAAYQVESESMGEYAVLAAQSRRICSLLEALPDARLTYLEVEHIIRTVFEPVPVQIAPDSALPFELCTEPGALIYPCSKAIWWNAVDITATPKPDFWTDAERSALQLSGCTPDAPILAYQLEKSLQTRPLYLIEQGLVLIVPQQIAGAEATPHALLSILETCWEDSSGLIVQMHQMPPAEILEKYGKLPQWQSHKLAQPKKPSLFLHTNDPLVVHQEGDDESFTQLENLLYYPHKWFMQKHLLLHSGYITDIKSDATLLGNLAHRFFEELLPNPRLLKMTAPEITEWMQGISQRILEEEGATLLLYGREIERHKFMHQLRRGLHIFVQMLQNNGWHVRQVEHSYTGKVLDLPIRCRTDVILQRGSEMAILDLKWAGTTRRADQIRNGEDIQLVTYARGLEPIEYWPHTGFYIISEGKLLMRNRDAFDNAIVPGKTSPMSHEDAAQQIFDRLEKTLAWRLAQLRAGEIEVRTTDTFQALEDMYGAELLELLNLPTESDKYDPYLTLLYNA